MNVNLTAARIILFLIFLSTFSLNGQTKKYSPDVEEKIRMVENNLAGWVHTGDNDTWTLADRMKKYNINGLSIAVIHNYQIEWARGYGFAGISLKRSSPIRENRQRC